MGFNASVCISAGHGKNSASVGYRDPGMDSKYIVDEAAVVENLAYRVARDLAALAIPTLFRNTGKFSLADDDAMRYDAETFIELHLNSFNGKARGTEAWVDSRYDKRDLSLARNIVNRIAQVGFTNRSVKENEWAVLKEHPGMDAVLVEVFFGDNAADVSVYNKRSKQVELAIVNGYLAFLGRKPCTVPPRLTPTGRWRLASKKYYRSI